MKHPVTPSRDRPVRRKARDEVQVVEPTPPVPSALSSFFSFRYSFTEISLHGDRAHVRQRSARLEDGKLSTETFDGELPRADVDRALHEAQRQAMEQATLWMRSLASWFLPWGGTGRRGPKG